LTFGIYLSASGITQKVVDEVLWFLPARRATSAVFAVERCLAVCPSVTRRYCV